MKAMVMKRTRPPRRKAMAMIRDMRLGNQTATVLLGNFDALIDFEDNDKHMIDLFIDKMPRHVRNHLVRTMGLLALADAADDLIEEADDQDDRGTSTASGSGSHTFWTGGSRGARRGNTSSFRGV